MTMCSSSSWLCMDCTRVCPLHIGKGRTAGGVAKQESKNPMLSCPRLKDLNPY